MGTLLEADYILFRKDMEQARLAAEGARTALNEHRRQHGC
jgi:hypothetical protein